MSTYLIKYLQCIQKKDEKDRDVNKLKPWERKKLRRK